MKTKKHPVALIIRDGWGISKQGASAAEKEGNAPLLAETPYHDFLYKNYPQSRLSASGLDVGLPEGQMGNSEVGHLNLGAGRIVYQELTRISKDIASSTFFSNPTLVGFLKETKSKQGALHLWGLLSDGGVHSHQEHLYALLKAAKEANLEEVYVHAFMDGRDTSPTGGADYVTKLLEQMEKIGVGKLASMIGRYYAMDRDKRWERAKLAYDLIFMGKGNLASKDPVATLKDYYEKGKTDEFIPATVFSDSPRPLITDDDSIIFFNFRADRARQMCNTILDESFQGFSREIAPKVALATMTQYSPDYGVPSFYLPQTMTNILGEIVSRAGLKQLRMAETEKYPHVTYFFNGGNEVPFEAEERKMAASPKVATYDLQPEMSAPELTQTLLDRLDSYDLVILNFANPDMVGHTGSLPAAIKAVETIDACLKKVLDKILELGGCALVTADHGNCEKMFTEEGKPHTAHTTNLVHFIYVGNDSKEVALEDGILADVSPTLLHLLGVEKPQEMTGKSLISEL